MVDAAVAAGVQQIVKLSVMGSGTEAFSEFSRIHARVEAKLQACGAAWTLLRPNMMMQNLFWYKQAIRQGTLPLPLAHAQVSHVDAKDVAAVAVHVLSEEGHSGKTYTLTGPAALTCFEVAAVLSEGGSVCSHFLIRFPGLPGWSRGSGDDHRHGMSAL